MERIYFNYYRGNKFVEFIILAFIILFSLFYLENWKISTAIATLVYFVFFGSLRSIINKHYVRITNTFVYIKLNNSKCFKIYKNEIKNTRTLVGNTLVILLNDNNQLIFNTKNIHVDDINFLLKISQAMKVKKNDLILSRN
ncbi:hypothetical protein GCM10023314_05510 [Algibacter agarivorans]|uniref:PH domain-containing protein n=1 Tax=Algibacter agarivorans TaxID=1109741 RepID=A0ABP9GBC2_9FLAO